VDGLQDMGTHVRCKHYLDVDFKMEYLLMEYLDLLMDYDGYVRKQFIYVRGWTSGYMAYDVRWMLALIYGSRKKDVRINIWKDVAVRKEGDSINMGRHVRCKHYDGSKRIRCSSQKWKSQTQELIRLGKLLGALLGLRSSSSYVDAFRLPAGVRKPGTRSHSFES